MRLKTLGIIFLALSQLCFHRCKDQADEPEPPEEEPGESTDPFYFGADLSYVNQILDHNGAYKDQGEVTSPYKIFKDHGADLVRLRLWHNPAWTKDVYENGTRRYNDLSDVEKAASLAKAQGLEVLLDFHYSDSWADPGRQEIPAAWQEIKDISVLRDSVYNYTFGVLTYLDDKGLMPEFVQTGNEINCGMLYTNAPSGFPPCNVCDGHWKNLGEVINSAIKAVRDVSAGSAVKTKVMLHVADPKNIAWWFDNIKTNGGVTDFEIIGFSYYPLWHTTIAVDELAGHVSGFRNKYGKYVMILETAYPWTTGGNDSYTNIFGGESALSGYPYTTQGQLDIMKDMTREMMEGHGYGIVYWEPAWITSEIKDLWGTGSSWENCAFFDFDGNVIQGMDFMNFDYQ